MNATSYIEQILEATPYEAAAVRPLTSHLKKYLRRTRQAGHCWRRKNERISDVFLRTFTHRRARVGQPARTYL